MSFAMTRRRPRNSRELAHRSLVAIALVWMLLVPGVESVVDPKPKPVPGLADDGSDEESSQHGNRKTDNPLKLNPLGESIKKSKRRANVWRIRKEYWEPTFQDIRNLVSPKNGTTEDGGSSRSSGTPFLSQWKFLTEGASASRKSDGDVRPLRRFEGFPSWERMLQDWSDEVQEYVDKTYQESGGEYRMGTYGMNSEVVDQQPTGDELSSTWNDSVVDKAHRVDVIDSSAKAALKEKIDIPVPSPAKPGEDILPHTNIADKSKRLLIVTTASLPWKTGTAVNPLLRAAYLTKGRKAAGGSVTLMLPWLERLPDQERVYGADNVFETPQDQDEYIRTWLRDDADLPEASQDLKIQWYTAWQNKVENSLYSMGDITALIDADNIDICILEEPEHLNWYRAPGESWTKKFKHVVGILHTNYFQYATDQPAALIRAPAMRLLCSWMCRAHCHRVIKLSGTLDQVAPEKELVENVHGVRGTFLDVGAELRWKLWTPMILVDPVFAADADPSVYFIGKMLWSKGLGSLMELLKYAEESAGLKVAVDMYGGGPDMDAAETKSSKLGLEMTFHGPVDHSELASSHKVFVNPSVSEVLCTTTAEALAMGKFVLVPSHPSNDFFAQFPNCLAYASKEEFVGNLYYALTHAPEPLTKEYAHELSWEAATERLEAAGCIPIKEASLREELTGVEITLPPLVENEQDRKLLATTFRLTRERFRQFRLRLSNEVQQSKVLPKQLRDRLVGELDKRLDFDVDEIFESPTLRLELSPAQLDKTLLKLYEAISEGPSGDIFRVVGGGGPIGLQNSYVKRQSQKKRKQMGSVYSLPSFSDYKMEAEEKEPVPTLTQRIRLALRRNLLKEESHHESPSIGTRNRETPERAEPRETPKMCYTQGCRDTNLRKPVSWSGLRSPNSMRLSPRRPGTRSFSLLI